MIKSKICIYENEFTNWKCPNPITHDSKSKYCILHDHELILTEKSIKYLKNEKVPVHIIKILENKTNDKFKGIKAFLDLLEEELGERISDTYKNKIYISIERSVGNKNSKLFLEELDKFLVNQESDEKVKTIHLDGIYYPKDFMECYQMTDEALDYLMSESLSVKIAKKLEPLKNKLIIGKENFEKEFDIITDLKLPEQYRNKLLKVAFKPTKFLTLFKPYERNRISKSISFAESVFFSKLYFRYLNFDKDINLGACVFYDYFLIGKINFDLTVTFGGSIFKKSLILNNVTFRGATFKETVFEKKALFSNCTFYNYASFDSIKMLDDSKLNHYDNYNTKDKKDEKLISFEYGLFPAAHHTWFENIDIGNFSFKATDLRFVNFINVKWAKSKWRFSKRNCLKSEFKDIHDEKERKTYFNDIRSQYQQLKINFEDAHNFGEAGDFHYGEMECKRKSYGRLRFLPSLTTLYWLSSGYGERPLRAAFNLFFILFIWIFSLMFIGLEPNAINYNYSKIDYEIKIKLNNYDKFIKDFLITYTYVQEILLREEKSDRIFYPIKLKNTWLNGELINTTGFVLVYVQLLLFLLSIRRKFRR